MNQSIDPAILTIFGINGNLAHIKLLPAIYYLLCNDLLPDNFRIVGVTLHEVSESTLLDSLEQYITKTDGKINHKVLDKLRKILSLRTIGGTNLHDYVNLKKHLDDIEDELGVCMTRLFYLAIPAQVFGPTVRMIGRAKLNTGCQHNIAESRLLAEKPFGFDLHSAQDLIELLSHEFDESEIYRIDHYLAKETVQNILTFRTQNPIYANSWDSKNIKRIMVTATEQIDIEGRAKFYEKMGALRDVVQSHLLQLLSLVIMDQPKSLKSDDIHAAKLKALRSIVPPAADTMSTHTIRAQYETYRDEVNNPTSNVETYAAMRLSSREKCWENIPIYLRTGKNLAEKLTEVTMIFESPDTHGQNQLALRIQPHEGIMMSLVIKKPGYESSSEIVEMEFNYGGAISAEHPDAYERVLIDALRGDKTLFATSDEVMECWRITQPIMDAWEKDRTPLLSYPAGSWGPGLDDGDGPIDEYLQNLSHPKPSAHTTTQLND